MKIQHIISILLFIALANGLETLQYDIFKTYSGDIHQTNKVNVGVLEVRKNIQYKQVQSSIEPKFSELVTKEDFTQGSVILSFVPKSSGGTQSEANVYKTAVVEKENAASDEIIAVVIGVDLNIKAINYVEKRSALQEIRSQVITTGAGKEQIAKIQVSPKKGPGSEGAPEDESFFTKYKWPIIIGIVLLYLTSQGGDAKPQEGAAPAAR